MVGLYPWTLAGAPGAYRDAGRPGALCRRYGRLPVDVRVAVRDDDHHVRVATPVAIGRREHGGLRRRHGSRRGRLTELRDEGDAVKDALFVRILVEVEAYIRGVAEIWLKIYGKLHCTEPRRRRDIDEFIFIARERDHIAGERDNIARNMIPEYEYGIRVPSLCSRSLAI